ncbi:type III polyketide synthase [Thalassobacillus hwangdonensis]|uniref:Type III polyketide synthase n=1 Tax=Thalassobacillus hwangdonensis TaxID=546108 RepID=A0ABW3KX35_9BACI
MAYILSIGRSLPKYELKQEKVKELVQYIFPLSQREKNRLLPVFDHAMIEQRQFVVDAEWFTETHGLQERNDIFIKEAVDHALIAMDESINNKEYLTQPVSYDQIDMILLISSTGIATPTIDARLMNQRDFREDVKRVPLFGLGCAGGVSGLARAYEWLRSFPTKNVMVVNVELCGLTFQKGDAKKSNFIGAALFGDGITATLVCGEKSELARFARHSVPRMTASDSRTMKDSISVMGWDVTDGGFEVVFNKSIPNLVKTFWKGHVDDFVDSLALNAHDFPFLVAHPGGKKVLEAYEEVLQLPSEVFLHSYETLKHHGNMSSVTVCYVLEKWMATHPEAGTKSLMAALGPGFSSELVSLEWV